MVERDGLADRAQALEHLVEGVPEFPRGGGVLGKRLPQLPQSVVGTPDRGSRVLFGSCQAISPKPVKIKYLHYTQRQGAMNSERSEQ